MNKQIRISTNFRVMLLVLFAFGALVTVTVGVVHAQGDGNDIEDLPNVPAPTIGDVANAAELEDLQTIATQEGISLQAAIDRYAWNDNFALAVARIREAAPAAFASAEIVDGSQARIAFVGPAPQSALGFIKTFRGSHSGISVNVRTNARFTESELERAIQTVHYAVLNSPAVQDAYTSFEAETGQIKTLVVLESTASDSALDNLRTLATTDLTAATRADILSSITVSVSISPSSDLGGPESASKHHGGEVLRTCTSGFGTKTGSGDRGISTAGHCSNTQNDDGYALTFEDEYEEALGDFQWHTGTRTHTDDFYAGSKSSTEVFRRDVSDVGSQVKGQRLCRNGWKSHKDCQEVRKLNVCNGSRCSLVQMGSHLSKSGDSGGPVYYGNTAYGLHQGKVYDPPPSSREVFSRADRMFRAMRVRVTTD